MTVVSINRKAYHNYEIRDSIEAGLVLSGTEIKSIREGKVNLREAYARPEGGEIWLHNVHIARYGPGSCYNHDPTRPRKLLLHREQIVDLTSQVLQKGLALVPVKLYFKNGIAKVELGLGRGRKIHDKRQAIVQRETQRNLSRALKLAKERR